MNQTRLLMGMPITVEIIDPLASSADFTEIFQYFTYVDQTFSTFKEDSEISRLNNGTLKLKDCSPDVKAVLIRGEETKKASDGYFDIMHKGKMDPSGIVKGWAILNAANLLKQKGYQNYYVEAGGDIQTSGKNTKGKKWQVGIKNPFMQNNIVKVLEISGQGIATSGTYIRGQHIYNPKKEDEEITDIVSLSVVGPNIYEADRFATAAFAMGKEGINFIEKMPGLEGYMIAKDGTAIYTSGWDKYIAR